MPKEAAEGRATSAAQEDYLKVLHALEGDRDPVPTSALAGALGVTSASVSEMLTKLAARDLISHDHHRGATLTGRGLAIAVEMVRHHRVLETYLVRALGYSWDEVHEEAERLEHAISEKLEQRMWEALGRPAADPHGDPIPSVDGTLPATPGHPLPEAPANARLRVSRISDRDPDKLRAIERLGLLPGTLLTVLEVSRWEGPVTLVVAGTQAAVPLGLARVIFVEEIGG